MVPLNDQDLMIDLIEQLGIPVILVSRNYLGSINHTVLSIEALQHRGIPIAGIVINGEPNPATETFIAKYSQIPIVFKVENFSEITREAIAQFVLQLDPKLFI